MTLKFFSNTYFYLTVFCLILAIPKAFASCPIEPKVSNALKGDAELLRIIDIGDMHAAQGIVSYFENNVEKIALSNGYTESNAAILDLNNGEIEHKANLSSTKRAQLLSSVFKTESHLWWTSYREEKIYRTDLDLTNVLEIPLPGLDSAVGISGFNGEGEIVVVNRDKINEILLVSLLDNVLVKSVPIHDLKQAAYDIDVYEGCVFLVESSAGSIWNFDYNELKKYEGGLSKAPKLLNWLHFWLSPKAGIKPNLWFSDGVRIQHLQIVNDTLYVIDTDNYSILAIDINSGEVAQYELPSFNIYRGLTVTSNGTVLLTGFKDLENIREDRTSIFEFRLVLKPSVK